MEVRHNKTCHGLTKIKIKVTHMMVRGVALSRKVRCESPYEPLLSPSKGPQEEGDQELSTYTEINPIE